METMAMACRHPYSPLMSFPLDHHEESSSSHLLWSPQVVPLHDQISEMALCHDEQDELFLDAVVRDACHGGALACDDLVAIQEELMEENSVSDLLLAAAEATEAGDVRLAAAMAARLDCLLDVDNVAFDRLAYHFTRGLRARISGADIAGPEAAAAALPAAAGGMSVYQMVQELSPFVKFAHFTANQAILEATEGDAEVRVVDFDVGDGIQWPPLMSDLARRPGGASFRLTAVTESTDAAAVTDTAGRRLSEFAASIGLPFHYTPLPLPQPHDGAEHHAEQELHTSTISEACRGAVLAWCNYGHGHSSPEKLRLLQLGGAKKLQAKMVVTVEEELFRRHAEAAAYVEFFCEALHHFAAVREALGSCFAGGGYGGCLRRVEREMLGPRIEDAVGGRREQSLTGGAPEGFRACGFSGCNVAQARFLVGLFDRGFGVVHANNRLALCWKSRPLTSVSVWTPMAACEKSL